MEPLRISYSASETVDVTSTPWWPARAPADYECGDPDTFCADLADPPHPDEHRGPRRPTRGRDPHRGRRRAPRRRRTRRRVRRRDRRPDQRHRRPDLRAARRARARPSRPPGHPRPHPRAHGRGRGPDLERVEFHACDRDYEANELRPRRRGQPTEGEVAEVAFRVNNFVVRPGNLPAPPATGAGLRHRGRPRRARTPTSSCTSRPPGA